ncbi:MAG: hypothetical protein M9951_04410 [Burkholderiaceae bacterium]|nr:hypothetical protein [Burkholderiaceae bacterium]
MNNAFPVCLRRALVALALGTVSMWAAAHGDEPHGDEPHPTSVAVSAKPGFEAASDTFEVVARLQPGALKLFVNRYETSEPVLDADVELESGSLKAQASFQADEGSYVVRDEAFLQALSRPGTHQVVVTLLAGDDADLLEGLLTAVSPAQEATSRSSAPGSSPALLAMLTLVVGGTLAPGAWYLRSRLDSKAMEGAR